MQHHHEQGPGGVNLRNKSKQIGRRFRFQFDVRMPYAIYLLFTVHSIWAEWQVQIVFVDLDILWFGIGMACLISIVGVVLFERRFEIDIVEPQRTR